VTSGLDEASVLSDEHVGRRVITGGAQRAVGFVVANLLTAASAVILLRHLRVDAFGQYGTVLALVGIVYGVSDLGLTVTGTRELTLCETEDERRDLLGHILGLRIVVSGVGVLGAIAFAFVAGYQGVLIIGTTLAGIGVLFQSIQAAMVIPLSVELSNGALAFSQVLQQAALLVGFAVLAIIGAGLLPFFAVQILVGVVLLATTPLLMSRQHFVTPRWTASRIRDLGRVGLPVAVGAVLGVLYLRLLVIMMSLLSGQPKQIGYFVTSTRVLELVGGLPFLVATIVLPVVTVAARDDHERLVYMTSRVAQVMVLAGVLAALVLWTLSAPIITVLGGAQYMQAGSVLQIQGFATITIFLTAAWQPALMGMHRLRSYVLAMSIGLAAVVIAGFILIPPFQATGAAVSAVIGEVVLCVSMYIAVRRAGPGNWLPLGPGLRTAAAAAVGVAVGLIPGLPTGVRALAVLAAFTATVIVLRGVPSEIVDALRAGSHKLAGHRRH
jgi:O-antigen/teichoic acid export membrane protein